jgi:hypothetical protein
MLTVSNLHLSMFRLFSLDSNSNFFLLTRIIRTHIIAETRNDDLLNDPRRRVDNECQRHCSDGPSHCLLHLDLFHGK